MFHEKVKPMMIKLSKKGCKQMEDCLIYGGCPEGGCTAICAAVYPEYTNHGGGYCPCTVYGCDAITDAIIDLFEYNDYEISKKILEWYIKLNGE